LYLIAALKYNSMQHLPLAIQTTYADLVDKLMDETVRAGAADEGGAFVVKLNKGRRYWYRQLPSGEGNHQRQHYVGPETPELLNRIEHHQTLVETSRVRRDLVRSLTASRLAPSPGGTVGKVLEALAKAGVFRLRGVLVGTVAYSCYGPMLGVRMPSASLMTADIDVAQFRSISIAVEERMPPVLDALRAVDPRFQPVPQLDNRWAAVSYTVVGTGRAAEALRVEFLTPSRGPVEDTPGHLPALGTSAQTLRFLDYLIYRERPAAVLYGSGVLVNVPDPARFAWHKLIVAERRVMPEKVLKDLAQAASLFEVLIEDRPKDVADMYADLAGPGRVRWQQIALDGLRKIGGSVQDKVLGVLPPLF
jgi:hypothetical protein